MEVLGDLLPLGFENREDAARQVPQPFVGRVQFERTFVQRFADPEVGVGVGQRDTGEVCQDLDGGLVLVAEGLAIDLVGEVDVTDVAPVSG